MIAVAPVPASRRVPARVPACPPGAPGLAFGLFLALTGVLIIRPTEIIPALDGAPLFHAVILACLAVTFPWVIAQLTPTALKARPITICVLGVAAAVPLSHVGHGGSEQAIAAATEFGKVVVYYLLLMAVVDTPKRFRIFVVWLLAFLAIHAGLALLHFHGQVEIPAMNPVFDSHLNKETGEAITVTRMCGVGLFGNPNDLSRILVVGIALTIYLMGQWPRALLPGLLGLAGLFAYCLTQTHSRGGLVALAVTLLTALQLRYGGKRTFILALLALPIALAFLGGRQTDLSAEEGTGQQRIQLWLEGFTALAHRPYLELAPTSIRKSRAASGPTIRSSRALSNSGCSAAHSSLARSPWHCGTRIGFDLAGCPGCRGPLPRSIPSCWPLSPGTRLGCFRRLATTSCRRTCCSGWPPRTSGSPPRGRRGWPCGSICGLSPRSWSCLHSC